MCLIPPRGESLGGLFTGVVKGSGNNLRMSPLTTPFIQSVQLWGYYSHFTFLTTLHRTYHVVTRALPIRPLTVMLH
jgi:hypothetical protein